MVALWFHNGSFVNQQYGKGHYSIELLADPKAGWWITRRYAMMRRQWGFLLGFDDSCAILFEL
jgi:hypothetical protein